MLIILFSIMSIWAKDVTIFEVRKTLPLNNNEKIYHDYYVSAGTQDGIKKGMILTATRVMPFKDTNLSKIEEDLRVDVGQLKIIHVQNSFSVARLYKIQDGPVLAYKTLMIGDRIDLNKARMPSSTIASKKITAKPKPSKKKVAGNLKQKRQKKVSVQHKMEQPSVPMSGEIPTVAK